MENWKQLLWAHISTDKNTEDERFCHIKDKQETTQSCPNLVASSHRQKLGEKQLEKHRQPLNNIPTKS